MYSEAVNGRTDNAVAKKKERQKGKQLSKTHYTEN